jgi:uncharacterized protein
LENLEERMFVVISPAKKLNEQTPVIEEVTQPRLLDKSKVLVQALQGYSVDQLGKLMKISPKLSELNQKRFQDFSFPFTSKNALMAIYMFAGDTYVGLDAGSLNDEDIDYAQDNLGILSGMFGLLRPKDLVQPYRLEMGTSLKVKDSKNLYAFWKNSIAGLIDFEKHTYIVNCASKEYFLSIEPHIDKKKIVTPIFKQRKGDVYKVISFSAKRARGAFARFVITNRITEIQQLHHFTYDGYVYKETDESLGTNLLFIKE